jgi:cytochrome c peroxidase
MVNPIEMDKQKHQQIVDRLRAIPSYPDQFEKVFGTGVTLDGLAKAIGTFDRVAALSGDSRYDKSAHGSQCACQIRDHGVPTSAGPLEADSKIVFRTA